MRRGAPEYGKSELRFEDADIGIVGFVESRDYAVEWIIETHIHADHLSAAPYIRGWLGGKSAIGERISDVQEVFGGIFNAGIGFHADGRQFDHLFGDRENYRVGSIEARAIHTPGHTPACMSHLIGDALFVGDTLLMPDFGTARCDFPGGDAGTMYDSIRKLYELDDDTRMFPCHDYKAPGRDGHVWETTVGEQKKGNVHLRHGTTRDAFVRMRKERDATLSMPKLILPSIQVNMRAGELPHPEENGIRYLKVPIDAL
ncbi:MAG: MBL fold metallo-hydrolase [Gammaproteobacteria bacterium]|nr:MBL fold metallo-hydrolase [Gammaproteobacteria bacterium]